MPSPDCLLPPVRLVFRLQLSWVKQSLQAVRYAGWKAGRRGTQNAAARDGLQHQVGLLLGVLRCTRSNPEFTAAGFRAAAGVGMFQSRSVSPSASCSQSLPSLLSPQRRHLALAYSAELQFHFALHSG